MTQQQWQDFLEEADLNQGPTPEGWNYYVQLKESDSQEGA